MQADLRVEVKRFYRPEDISSERAYAASFYEVYASDELLMVDLEDVIGHCKVVAAGAPYGEHPKNPASLWAVLCMPKSAIPSYFVSFVQAVDARKAA